jgi:hypothetical protein
VGNTDPTPASRTWTVDTTKPTVTSVSPREGARSAALTANVQATCSEAMKGASVKGAFKLYEGASTTPIPATVVYKRATNKAVLDPSADLKGGTTYRAEVTTQAKDLAGNALDQDPSTPGDQPKSWTFTTTI